MSDHLHDPLTCDVCVAERTAAQIAAIEAVRDRYKAALEHIAHASVDPSPSINTGAYLGRAARNALSA